MNNPVKKSMSYVLTPEHNDVLSHMKSAIYDTNDKEIILKKDQAFNSLYYAIECLKQHRLEDFLFSIGLKRISDKKRDTRWQKSIDAFKKSYKAFKETNDELATAFCDLFLGDAYLQMNEEKNARDAYIRSLNILEKHNNRIAWSVSKKLKGLEQ